jgi:hypothetical protein
VQKGSSPEFIFVGIRPRASTTTFQARPVLLQR